MLQMSAHVQDAGGLEARFGEAGVRVFIRREGGAIIGRIGSGRLSQW